MSARPKKPPTLPPEDEGPTSIYDSSKPRVRQPRAASPPPMQIEAVSMKTPGTDKIAVDHMRAEPVLKRPKLRAISEVTPVSQSLGYLAPPVSHSQVRSRRARDVVLVVSLSIIVASIVALIIWFLAR
jgi:hypothetical protein